MGMTVKIQEIEKKRKKETEATAFLNDANNLLLGELWNPVLEANVHGRDGAPSTAIGCGSGGGRDFLADLRLDQGDSHAREAGVEFVDHLDGYVFSRRRPRGVELDGGEGACSDTTCHWKGGK